MNQRIQELAEQAVVAVDNPFPGNPLNEELEKMYIPDCFAEKFAELIVRECARVADQWVDDEDNGTNLVSEKLKQHFGVE
jgi:hypothetical protein|nr:hypothetical protein [Oxalobacteraceae bacterium]